MVMLKPCHVSHRRGHMSVRVVVGTWVLTVKIWRENTQCGTVRALLSDLKRRNQHELMA